jgi:hypothetical protein
LPSEVRGPVYRTELTLPTSPSQQVDFSYPMYDLSLRILVNKLDSSPVANRSIWQFLRPFSWTLWLLIFLFCIVFGVTLYVMERRKNEFDFTYGSVPANVGMCMFFSKCVVGMDICDTKLCDSTASHTQRFPCSTCSRCLCKSCMRRLRRGQGACFTSPSCVFHSS